MLNAQIKVMKANVAILLWEKLDFNTTQKVEGNDKDKSRTNIIEIKYIPEKNENVKSWFVEKTDPFFK